MQQKLSISPKTHNLLFISTQITRYLLFPPCSRSAQSSKNTIYTFCQKNHFFDIFYNICQNHPFSQIPNFPTFLKNPLFHYFHYDSEKRQNTQNTPKTRKPQKCQNSQKWGYLENSPKWEDPQKWTKYPKWQKWGKWGKCPKMAFSGDRVKIGILGRSRLRPKERSIDSKLLKKLLGVVCIFF